MEGGIIVKQEIEIKEEVIEPLVESAQADDTQYLKDLNIKQENTFENIPIKIEFKTPEKVFAERWNCRISDLEGVGAEVSPDHSYLKAEVSLCLDAFESPTAYVNEIHRLVLNGVQVYSISTNGNKIRYGRITTDGQFLLIHAVDLHEKPEGSTSSVWFDDLKGCGGANDDYPYVFMKILNRADGSEELLEIVLLDSERDGFIELCTGEGGPSYKGRKLDPIRSGGRLSLGQNVPFGEEGTGDVLGYGEGWRGPKETPWISRLHLQNFSRGKFEIVKYREGDPRDVFGEVFDLKNKFFLFKEDLLIPDWEIVDCGLLFW